MNNNYLKYNNLGILVDSQLEQVSQGNHNVDAYYIGYDVYDYTNGYVTVSVTLPDGTQLPEFATSPKDFEFNGSEYKGFVFVLRDTLTSQPGNLSMTFNLKNIDNDTQLCSSRLNVLIHDSDVSVAPTITQEQYDQMQEVIRENTVKSNEALKKANDALYHDATIVKINGEVQQTWDATISQKISEESLNDLDLPNTTITSNGATVTVTNGGIVINGTPTATAVIDIPINLNVGTETYTYAGFNDISKGYSSDYIAIRGDNDTTLFSNSLNSNNKTFNASSSSWNVFRIRLGAGNAYNNYAVKPMLVKGNIVPPKFGTYNQNRHITNPQAEFLKDEFGKISNDFNINNNYFSTQDNGTKIVLKNVSEKINYSKDENKITINSYNTSGYNWLSTTAELEKNEDYFISFVAGTGNVKVVGINSLEIGSIGTILSSGNNQTFNSGNYNYYIISLYPTEAGMTFSNIMINKGNKALPYQPYNSSSHITNAQADFLKSEYDRSFNKLYGLLTINSKTQNNATYSLINGTLSVSGTPSANTFEYLSDYIKLKAGTYFFAFNSNKSSGVRLVTGDGSSTTSIAEKNKPFTLTTDRSDIRVQMRLGSGGSYDGAVFKEFMILDGDWTDKQLPSYQEWNGYPLHPKDIKPVLLWENASPTSDFTSVNTNLTTLDRSPYVRLRMWYSDVSGSCYKYVDFANIASNGCWLSGVVDYDGSNQHVLTRKIIMSKTYPTTINFGECYENNSVAPKRLVPIKLEGLYY